MNWRASGWSFLRRKLLKDFSSIQKVSGEKLVEREIGACSCQVAEKGHLCLSAVCMNVQKTPLCSWKEQISWLKIELKDFYFTKLPKLCKCWWVLRFPETVPLSMIVHCVDSRFRGVDLSGGLLWTVNTGASPRPSSDLTSSETGRRW